MAEYNKQSPYSNTATAGDYLDIMTERSVINDRSDETYVIESRYDMRPDLLAYDRFGSSRYWWLFALRNKDTIIDPIQDFRAGIVIRIPKIENVR
jgi:hypothetical protein